MMDWGKEAQGGGGGVYPEGSYRVRIDAWEYTTAKTGTKQVKWTTKILEPDTHKNMTITTFTALTDKSLWKIARLVKGAGIDVSRLPKMDVNSNAFSKVLDMCKGRTSYWHLTQTPGQNGAPRNEVDDFVIDPNQGEVTNEPVEPDLPEFLKEG